MGSNYFGEPNNYFGGNERGAGGLSSSSSTSSSRKGKKNGGSDKPKQPQRGLGVAQLEKIRLHSQLGCNNYLPPAAHHNPYASNFNQEDIRLQTSYNSSSSSSFSYSSSTSPTYGFQGPHGVMMGLQDLDRANVSYGDSQSNINVARWHQGNSGFGTQHFVEPATTTRSFFEPGIEGAFNMTKKKELSSQNSESSNTQEIDLELRLSL